MFCTLMGRGVLWYAAQLSCDTLKEKPIGKIIPLDPFTQFLSFEKHSVESIDCSLYSIMGMAPFIYFLISQLAPASLTQLWSHPLQEIVQPRFRASGH